MFKSILVYSVYDVDAGCTMPPKNFLFFLQIWIKRKFFRHSFHFSSRNCHVTFTLNFFLFVRLSHCRTALKMIDSFFSYSLHSTSLTFLSLSVCNVFIFQLFDVVFFAMTFFLVYVSVVCAFYFNTWCRSVYVNNVHQTISVAIDTTYNFKRNPSIRFFKKNRYFDYVGYFISSTNWMREVESGARGFCVYSCVFVQFNHRFYFLMSDERNPFCIFRRNFKRFYDLFPLQNGIFFY